MSTLWLPCRWCGQSIDVSAATETHEHYGVLHKKCAEVLAEFCTAGSASSSEVSAVVTATRVMDKLNATDLRRYYGNQHGIRYRAGRRRPKKLNNLIRP